MLPILYSSITEGTVPSNYGVGVLSDCISATVKEARNGEYELTMEYAAEGIHASDIVPNAVIKAKPNYTDDPQLFRIYKVGKTINGKFTVNAQHISYDLSGKVITSGTAASLDDTITLLNAQSGFFVISSDKSVSAPFEVAEPSSVRSWFGGKQGSILDVYGPGEWKYDNFNASFLAARGQDRGVTIRYGKNLTELSQTLDMTNLCSAIIPYYKAQDGTVTTGSEVSTGLVGIDRKKAVNFSSEVDPESATPIATQLSTLAAAYIANNNFTTIKNSITLNFVQMKNLTERVDLCDTVHIYFEPLGLTATAKCIETVWDVLADRYTSTKFGDATTNIADTIVAQQKEIQNKPSETSMSQAIKQATELITGNLGGYVVLHDSNGDGKPDEILIMDDPDITQAVKVWRWNQAGLGYSSTGYAGPYGLAMTANGEIVADFITTGTLNADLIKAGVIEDAAGNSTIDMSNGAAVMKDFKAKNSFQFLDENGVEKGYFSYTPADGTNLILKNQSGDLMIWLLSDSLGGSVYVYNATTKNTAVEATVDGNNAGVVYVNNSSGTDKIDLFGYNGHIWCTTVHQGSSRKIKKNIIPIEDAAKILELQAVSFDYIEEEMGTDCRGFIAEDVAEVLPNLVIPEEGKKPAGLDYISMIPYLQAVIKDQERRIAELEKKINEK
jgi:phage minor structural protein